MIVQGLPHACGGVSMLLASSLRSETSSPRMWGCFHGLSLFFRGRRVFPTHVGVFLRTNAGSSTASSLPHACGGVSVRHHACRCRGCLPHACGGVSGFERGFKALLLSSPRMWGCFRTARFTTARAAVFPTHVGVFLRLSTFKASRACLPHACGGVSADELLVRSPYPSSPRMWGCFSCRCPPCHDFEVFPTHVGVFLVLPTHARAWIRSSPRMWGCFHAIGGHGDADDVFPTHVGVFPSSCLKDRRSFRLPHACGGVSTGITAYIDDTRSSPRMWGCFYWVLFGAKGEPVFPTHVGVFPPAVAANRGALGLPHACGGVSSTSICY